MRQPDTPTTHDGVGAGLRRFAQVWAAAIRGTSYVSMTETEIELHLLCQTTQLTNAIGGELDPATTGTAIGEKLVHAHFTSPLTLQRSIEVINTKFLAEVSAELRSVDPATQTTRLSVALGGLAAGFSSALRGRTLEEQEQIRQAGWVVREATERALRHSEARFRAVFSGAAIGIGIADISGNILDANPAMVQILGYSVDELCNSSIARFVDLDDAPQLWAQYQELVNGERERVQSVKRYVRLDGGVVWTDMVISLVRDEDGHPRYVVALIEDISERRRLENSLHHQALHDPLTGLPNRTLFFDRLRHVCSTAGPDDRVGLCYLDLDRFKAINDSLGHHVGDELLIQLAARLRNCAAEHGHIVSRMGGDEFVLLVEDCTGTEQLQALAETLLETLRAPFNIADHQLTVAASIGLVEHAAAGADPAELMKAADITLYWAKSDSDGGWALHDATRRGQEVARYELSAAMPRALERGEFFVEYQPLVRLSDSKTIGVEALVRWQHPELGRLSPQHFIDLAEETGQIVVLGRWVLEQACRQARAWQDAYGDEAPFVSVNLAVRQLREPGVIDDVLRIVSEVGIDPQRIQLELTESALMGPTDESLERLRTLSEHGFAIAIDDFGTGYSNLAYLRRLPVHALKLAGSFVTGLRAGDNGDSTGEEIMRMLVELSHTLALRVTAEGIETDEQARQLRDLGCDNGQGWLFGKPGPPESISELLDTAATEKTSAL